MRAIPLFPRRLFRTMPDFVPPSCPTPRASVIIVTYNTPADLLAGCLRTLRETQYPDFEVILVDNASRAENREAVRELAGREMFVQNEENRGFSGGCNDGVRHATGDFLVFLNADTEVRPDWLTELLAPFHRDPRVAITGCKMLFPGPERRIQHAGGILHGNGMAEHIGYQEPDAGQRDQELAVDYVTGAGMAIRRAFFDLCGGFDEDYYPAYCEEADLCWRARHMGYRVLYTPKAALIHHESASLGNQTAAFQRLIYRNRMLFCLKNYRLREWLFCFLPAEAYWLRMPWSRGLRRMQVRAYWEALLFLFRKDLIFPL